MIRILSLSVLFAVSAFGVTTTVTTTSSQESVVLPSERTHTFSAAFIGHSFDYTENLEAPAKSKESGLFPGVIVGWEMESLSSRLLFGADLAVSGAQTDYDGSLYTSNGVVPHKSKTDNLWVNTEGRVGLRLAEISGFGKFKLYTGLGYHQWNRTLKGTGGYGERYSWAYLPLGLKIETRLSQYVGMGLDSAIKVPFFGHITVNDYPVSYKGQRVGQGNGSLGSKIGARIGMPVSIDTGSRLGFSLIPWFEYVGIGQGDQIEFDTQEGKKVSTAREPESSNYVYGFNAAVLFSL